MIRNFLSQAIPGLRATGQDIAPSCRLSRTAAVKFFERRDIPCPRQSIPLLVPRFPAALERLLWCEPDICDVRLKL
jgi:hypothetical protein